MSKLYNTFESISSDLANYLKESSNNISKPQAYNLSYIVIVVIQANSIIASKVALNFKGTLSNNKPDSNEKRVKRFFNNSIFNIYNFYADFISNIISTYKVKHSDNNVFISLDHTYNKDDFTSLVFTLRIGKQSIPLWFKCFNGTNDKEAFSIDTIKDGILFVHNLFNKKYNLIFLADRWFNDPAIFKYIDSLGDKFCIRTKTNVSVSTDGNEFRSLTDIKPRTNSSKLLKNILFTQSQKMNVNLAISPSKNTDDPWYIVTNLDPSFAIKYYHKRFGAIEFLFKSQKSNGFNLEDTTVSNITAFRNMFGATCVAITWMIILGADYVKNKSHCKFNLYDIRRTKGKIIRVKSLFNIGMTIFKHIYNSFINYNLKFNFILYDI